MTISNHPWGKKIPAWPASDFIFFSQIINREWLTNFVSSDGFVLIRKKPFQIQVFLDPRYYQEGKEKLASYCQVLPLKSFSLIWKKLQGKVSFEDDLPYFLWKKLQTLNPQLKLLATDFANWRLVKTKAEIAKIRKICQITKQIWEQLVQFVKKNHQLTELAVEKFILQQFLIHGVKETAFFPIVASGTNAAHIHTKAKDVVIKDHLLCDFGGKLNGYCSDFSRTLILNPGSKILPYHHFITQLQEKILAKLKPGVTIKEIALYAQKLYQTEQLPLLHALGHGIGLEVHEPPLFSSTNQLVLVPGMVFTIEPGVYLPQLGGVRKEDVVLITKTGCEILTS